MVKQICGLKQFGEVFVTKKMMVRTTLKLQKGQLKFFLSEFDIA